MDKLRDDGHFTPDTGINGAGIGGDIPQEPDQARPEDDPQAGKIKPEPELDTTDTGTFEGKKVFSAHELNQSGEDKEYFHPDKDHRFDTPKDANAHALTPDVEVTPGNTVKKIG